MQDKREQFEICKTDKGTAIRLHGTEEAPVEIDEDYILEILGTAQEGWHISIRHAIIEIPFPPAKLLGKIKEISMEILHSNIFIVHGTTNSLADVSAQDVLAAIADSKLISINHAHIDGILNIDKIRDRLEEGFGSKLVIKQPVSIRNTDILGYMRFARTSFARGAAFYCVHFHGDVDFNVATYRAGVSFERSSFSKRASFLGCHFVGDTIFTEATFDGEANFNGAVFDSYVSFNDTDMGADTKFDLVRFGGRASFYGAKLKELTPKTLFTIGQSHKRSMISGGASFFEKAGNAYLHNREYQYAGFNFRDAKLEYHKDGKYDDAGRMYIREKESSRLHLKSEKGNYLKRAWLWIWKLTSNYGESPIRFIGWIVAIVLIFALIYLPILSTWFGWWPSIEFKEYPFHRWSDGFIDGFLFNIVAAVYYSAVTFATLGFGDITPINILGRVCAIAEVLLGYLMFGVLITLVARKMTRS